MRPAMLTTSQKILLILSLPATLLFLYFLLKRDEEEDEDCNVSVKVSRLRIPHDSVGTLIGLEGVQMKTIQEKTGTRMSFQNDMGTNNDKILVISGSADGVRQAESFVRQLLEEILPIVSEKIYIPRSAIKTILGINRENIRNLSRKSNAKIILNRTEARKREKPFVEVEIRGASTSIMSAKRMIIDTISKEKDNYLYAEGTHQHNDNYSTCFVTAVEHPGHFWIQKIDWNNDHLPDHLDTLIKEMNEFYGSEISDDCAYNEQCYGIGDMVASKLPHDGNWYRAEVRDMNGADLVLYFVDFGDTEIVNHQTVRHLSSKFLSLSFQATECCLANIEPLGARWSEPAIKEFEKLTSVGKWQPLMFKIIGQTYHPSKTFMTVALSLEDSSKTLNIADQLVSKGFAQHSSNVVNTHNDFKEVNGIEGEKIRRHVNISYSAVNSRSFCDNFESHQGLYESTCDHIECSTNHYYHEDNMIDCMYETTPYGHKYDNLDCIREHSISKTGFPGAQLCSQNERMDFEIVIQPIHCHNIEKIEPTIKNDALVQQHKLPTERSIRPPMNNEWQSSVRLKDIQQNITEEFPSVQQLINYSNNLIKMNKDQQSETETATNSTMKVLISLGKLWNNYGAENAKETRSDSYKTKKMFHTGEQTAAKKAERAPLERKPGGEAAESPEIGCRSASRGLEGHRGDVENVNDADVCSSECPRGLRLGWCLESSRDGTTNDIDNSEDWRTRDAGLSTKDDSGNKAPVEALDSGQMVVGAEGVVDPTKTDSFAAVCDERRVFARGDHQLEEASDSFEGSEMTIEQPSEITKSKDPDQSAFDCFSTEYLDGLEVLNQLESGVKGAHVDDVDILVSYIEGASRKRDAGSKETKSRSKSRESRIRTTKDDVVPTKEKKISSYSVSTLMMHRVALHPEYSESEISEVADDSGFTVVEKRKRRTSFRKDEATDVLVHDDSTGAIDKSLEKDVSAPVDADPSIVHRGAGVLTIDGAPRDEAAESPEIGCRSASRGLEGHRGDVENVNDADVCSSECPRGLRLGWCLESSRDGTTNDIDNSEDWRTRDAGLSTKDDSGNKAPVEALDSGQMVVGAEGVVDPTKTDSFAAVCDERRVFARGDHQLEEASDSFEGSEMTIEQPSEITKSKDPDQSAFDCFSTEYLDGLEVLNQLESGVKGAHVDDVDILVSYIEGASRKRDAGSKETKSRSKSRESRRATKNHVSFDESISLASSHNENCLWLEWRSCSSLKLSGCVPLHVDDVSSIFSPSKLCNTLHKHSSTDSVEGIIDSLTSEDVSVSSLEEDLYVLLQLHDAYYQQCEVPVCDEHCRNCSSFVRTPFIENFYSFVSSFKSPIFISADVLMDSLYSEFFCCPSFSVDRWDDFVIVVKPSISFSSLNLVSCPNSSSYLISRVENVDENFIPGPSNFNEFGIPSLKDLCLVNSSFDFPIDEEISSSTLNEDALSSIVSFPLEFLNSNRLSFDGALNIGSTFVPCNNESVVLKSGKVDSNFTINDKILLAQKSKKKSKFTHTCHLSENKTPSQDMNCSDLAKPCGHGYISGAKLKDIMKISPKETREQRVDFISESHPENRLDLSNVNVSEHVSLTSSKSYESKEGNRYFTEGVSLNLPSGTTKRKLPNTINVDTLKNQRMSAKLEISVSNSTDGEKDGILQICHGLPKRSSKKDKNRTNVYISDHISQPPKLIQDAKVSPCNHPRRIKENRIRLALRKLAQEDPASRNEKLEMVTDKVELFRRKK